MDYFLELQLLLKRNSEVLSRDNIPNDYKIKLGEYFEKLPVIKRIKLMVWIMSYFSLSQYKDYSLLVSFIRNTHQVIGDSDQVSAYNIRLVGKTDVLDIIVQRERLLISSNSSTYNIVTEVEPNFIASYKLYDYNIFVLSDAELSSNVFSLDFISSTDNINNIMRIFKGRIVGRFNGTRNRKI